MEMFSFGKEASTLSQVSYFSVKEEAKEDIVETVLLWGRIRSGSKGKSFSGNKEEG